MTRIGIYPGTFDPITVGHMDIIKPALHVVDGIIIGVALDDQKAPVCDLSMRTRLIESDTRHLGADAKRVKVKPLSGPLTTCAE
jgi:pantetheine-phosphate adenylyltransferase